MKIAAIGNGNFVEVHTFKNQRSEYAVTLVIVAGGPGGGLMGITVLTPDAARKLAQALDDKATQAVNGVDDPP